MIVTGCCGAAAGLVCGPALARWGQQVCDHRTGWLSMLRVTVCSVFFALLAGLAARTGLQAVGLITAALFASLLLCCDLAVTRLPNPIVLASYPSVIAIFALAAAIEGRWPEFGRALLAGLALGGCYLILGLISPQGLCLGDVKYSGHLGFVLGWWGWLPVCYGTLAAFFLGAGWGLVLLIVRKGNRRTQFPFGPCMIIGATLAILWAVTH